MWRAAWRLALAVTIAVDIIACRPPAHAGDGIGWLELPAGPLGKMGVVATAGPGPRIYALFVASPDGNAGEALVSYDLDSHTWAKPVSIFGAHSALVTIGARIYLLGGTQSAHFGSYTFIFSPRTHKLTLDGHAFCNHSGGSAALGHDGRIYQVAGGEGGAPGACAEAYAPPRHAWALIASMPRAEVAPAVTTGRDGRIYVLGGGSSGAGSDPAVTTAAQVYDPRTNRWALAAPMPTARMSLAAVTGLDGRIYAIGGTDQPVGFTAHDQPHALRTVDIYDPRTNQWSKGPSLHVARYGLGAVITPDGKIYALGGWGTNAVESYQVPPTASP